jgi:hypothetical protein
MKRTHTFFEKRGRLPEQFPPRNVSDDKAILFSTIQKPVFIETAGGQFERLVDNGYSIGRFGCNYVGNTPIYGDNSLYTSCLKPETERCIRIGPLNNVTVIRKIPVGQIYGLNSSEANNTSRGKCADCYPPMSRHQQCVGRVPVAKPASPFGNGCDA